jgi:hypothetical protein
MIKIVSDLLTFRELYCRTNKVFKDKSGFIPVNIFRYGVAPTELYIRVLHPFLQRLRLSEAWDEVNTQNNTHQKNQGQAH